MSDDIAAHVAALRTGDDAAKKAAARALWILARDDDRKVAIAKAGGIAPLVALARGGTDGQKKNAAGALRNLALNETAKAAVKKAGW